MMPSTRTPLGLSRRGVLKGALLAAAASAVGPALAACSESGTSSSAGDTLVVALTSFGSESSVPWLIGGPEQGLWAQVYDKLIVLNKDTYALEPSLATSWEPSSDYTSWTVKIRPGVRFHENYGELTSTDVAYSIQQYTAKTATGSSTGTWLLNPPTSYDTRDATTVVLHFASPNWMVPDLLATGGQLNIVSKKYFDQVGVKAAASHPIGTGPYHFVSGRPGQEYAFAAVPNHWRKTPAFANLRVRLIPDASTSLLAVRAGEVDVAVVGSTFLKQASQANIRVLENQLGSPGWLIYPGLSKPGRPDYQPQFPWVGDANDPRSLANAKLVREALALAVNKQAIIDNVFFGHAKNSPFGFFVLPVFPFASNSWTPLPYDPARAKQLLAQAGYPNGFSIEMATSPLHPDGADLTQAISQDWQAIGVTTRLNNVPLQTLLSSMKARHNRMTVTYASPVATNPTSNLGLISTNILNLVANGAAIDDDIKRIESETDQTKRYALEHDLSQYLYDQHYGLMLPSRNATWVVSKKVGDWATLGFLNAPHNYEYITKA
ncbi:ABC transporter substrate-binding protein [Amycolatopsis sp. NPDC051372]|uniref:ABC transporter substrate-binding protein n=1 Tax=Amycolatopsis sp. NPDC051372 TaxID=3155669 RepID=UPI003448CC63